MAPVAGSAYTYAYTTLGEIFAWIIGWDLILEYAMGCATVASAWSGYLNEFLLAISHNRLQIPRQLLSDPFTKVDGLTAAAVVQLAVGVHHDFGHGGAGVGHPRERTDQRPVGVHQVVRGVVRDRGGRGLRAAGQLDGRSVLHADHARSKRPSPGACWACWG